MLEFFWTNGCYLWLNCTQIDICHSNLFKYFTIICGIDRDPWIQNVTKNRELSYMIHEIPLKRNKMCLCRWKVISDPVFNVLLRLHVSKGQFTPFSFMFVVFSTFYWEICSIYCICRHVLSVSVSFWFHFRYRRHRANSYL